MMEQADLETILKNARGLKDTGQSKTWDYERYKAQLLCLRLTDTEYQAAIRKLCEVMDL